MEIITYNYEVSSADIKNQLNTHHVGEDSWLNMVGLGIATKHKLSYDVLNDHKLSWCDLIYIMKSELALCS